MQCKIERIDPRAVLPKKAHPSDVGYDLYLIDIQKTIGSVTFYRTGLLVEPPMGYSVDIMPRSSISKSGYLLANSVGIVDPHYRGELLVALLKYDDNATDLALPCKIAQIVFRKLPPDINIVEAEVDKNTDRGSGGFGSTGH